MLRSMWVFKRKILPNGKIEKYKGRLVVLGNNQVEGIDYGDVFSPASRQESNRILMTVSVVNRWKARSLDVTAAFLHGKNLGEEVYMEQPEGFRDHGSPNHVCKLILPLYGLHQSARLWNEQLTEFLQQSGLRQSEHDPYLFFLLEGECLHGLLTIHIDDIAFAEEDSFISSFSTSLKSPFPISANKPLESHLSICISRSPDLKYFNLNQKSYIEKLTSQYFPGKPPPTVHTPYINGFNTLSPSLDISQSNSNYNSLIGALLWLAQCTRPDISFAINRPSQFLKKNDDRHFHAALRVLAYVFHTQEVGLVLGGENRKLEGYCDSDWAENPHDRSSTSGFLFRLSDGLILWKSRKQRSTALSSTEAEYMAMSDAGRELMWLCQILHEIHFLPQGPTVLHYDNTGSAALANNPVHHSRSKNIDLRYHFIRSLVKKNHVSLEYVKTKELLADILTKPLARINFEGLLHRLGLDPTRKSEFPP